MDTNGVQSQDRLLDKGETCRLLGIKDTKFNQLIATGELGSIKIGRARRVPYSQIERFIREKLAETGGQPNDHRNR